MFISAILRPLKAVNHAMLILIPIQVFSCGHENEMSRYCTAM